MIGFQEDSFPSKYLGTPLVDSIVRKGSWAKLLEKMRKRQARQTSHPLNISSQLMLVKLVLQAMLVYPFSRKVTPKDVLKKIHNPKKNPYGVGRGSRENGP